MNQAQKKKPFITKLPSSSDDADLWENGQLGASEKYACRVSVKETQEIHKALGIESIVVRLQKDLANKLKVLAKQAGTGYQPFIRHILSQYVMEANSSRKKNTKSS